MAAADDRSERRREDRRFRTNWRENAHRDVWMFLLSILVLISIVTAYNQNKDRIQDIQRSRLEVCERSNARHDQAIKTTMELLARPVTPQRKLTPAQRAASRRQIIRWVDSLVPKVDCAKILQPPKIPSQQGK